MSFIKSATALAGLVWAASFALSVTAQPAPVSDTVTLVPPGEVVPIVVSITESSEPSGGVIEILISSFPTGNPSQYGSYTVLTEPDGTISDVFGVIPVIAGDVLGIGAVAFNFAFFSDGQTGLTTVPSAFINPNGGTPITLPEGNGGPFPITDYLSPTLFAGYTGTFSSDVERVPEPATLALLGLGLAGLGFSRRRKRG